MRGGRLLDRYAPAGPVDRDSAAAWKSWWLANKPYLFFSDSGGYRWYIDPLAKKRQIPTLDLRGPHPQRSAERQGQPGW